MAELQDLIYHFSNDGLNINVEVRPLVKCKECKWWDVDSNNIFCEYGRVPKDDWFCADGEMKHE